MQLQRDEPLDAGVREEPRREARRTRLAALAHVLASVAEVGHDRTDPRGAGGARGVGEEGQGHQPLVRRRRGRLHDVEVRGGDVGLDADAGFAVGKAAIDAECRHAAQTGYGCARSGCASPARSASRGSGAVTMTRARPTLHA